MIFYSEEEKEQLVNQISYLFKEITTEGFIKGIKKENKDYTCELWHWDQKFRNLYFDFDKDKLVKMEVIGG